jgi:hypothetical protein
MDKQKKYLDFVVDDLIERTKKMMTTLGNNIVYYPPWRTHGFIFDNELGPAHFVTFKKYLIRYYGISGEKNVKHILDKYGSTEDEATYCWYRYFLVLRNIKDDMVRENRLKNLNESISEKRLMLVKAIVDDIVNKTEIWEHPDPSMDSMEIRVPDSFIAWKWGDSKSGYAFTTRAQVWDFFDLVKKYDYPANFCTILKQMFPINDEECMEIWTLYVEEMRIRINQQLEKGGWGIRV